MSVNTADLLSHGPTQTLVQAPDTSGWYNRQFGCLRSDPTLVARRHTFPDAVLPPSRPFNPATPVRFTEASMATSSSLLPSTWSSQRIGCQLYQTSSAIETPPYGPETIATAMEMARQHPQFAFKAGAPATDHDVWVESQLRGLDRHPGTCSQPAIPLDGPLFRNDVAPPTPVGVPEGVQNACNPQAAMIRGSSSSSGCRTADDRVASSLSSKRFNNFTRWDTAQMPTLSR